MLVKSFKSALTTTFKVPTCCLTTQCNHGSSQNHPSVSMRMRLADSSARLSAGLCASPVWSHLWLANECIPSLWHQSERAGLISLSLARNHTIGVHFLDSRLPLGMKGLAVQLNLSFACSTKENVLSSQGRGEVFLPSACGVQ